MKAADATRVSAFSDRVVQEVERAVVGKRLLLQQIMAAVLSGGHVLMEDYPGLAKTLISKSFATALGLTFRRSQFTPDLLPGDITGGYVYERVPDMETHRFALRKGPVFANIVLAEEINRASPKIQSALLEAMQESQVTHEAQTLPLPAPFIVIATQNPIEYEGTFPLLEAQLDLFLMRLSVGYPTKEQDQEILQRRQERREDEFDVQQVASAEMLLKARDTVETIYVDRDLQRYIVPLAAATREHREVAVGASSRGSLTLLRLSRAWAALHGRDHVVPDDVKIFAKPSFVHRLVLQPYPWMERNAADDILDGILRTIHSALSRQPHWFRAAGSEYSIPMVASALLDSIIIAASGLLVACALGGLWAPAAVVVLLGIAWILVC